MKAVILIIILSLFSSYAISDEVSHKAAAEELILLSNYNKILDQVWVQVGSMVDQQFQEMGAPEELRPIFKKYTGKMFNVVEKALSFENMKEDMITIYVKTYSESEIRAISEFYKSHAGRIFLEKMPELVQESMAISQKKMPQMMKKINVISEEMAQEIERYKDKQQN